MSSEESGSATERRLYLRPVEVLMSAVCVILVVAVSMMMFFEGYWYVAGFGVFTVFLMIWLLSLSNRMRRPINNV